MHEPIFGVNLPMTGNEPVKAATLSTELSTSYNFHVWVVLVFIFLSFPLIFLVGFNLGCNIFRQTRDKCLTQLQTERERLIHIWVFHPEFCRNRFQRG